MKKCILTFVFLFSFVFGIKGAHAATISDGIYKIQSALDSNKVVDVSGGYSANNTNVQLYTSNGTNAQKWKIESIGDGLYSISTLLDENKKLDVHNAGKKNGTNVKIYERNWNDAQKWYFEDAGDGYYYIISKCNSLYLDVSGAKTTNGTNIQMYKGNKTKAQKFKLIEILNGENIIEDGTYKIAPNGSNNLFLNTATNNSVNSSNVLINNKDSLTNLWDIKYLNNGYYNISPHLDNSKSLDVSGGYSTNKTNVQLYYSNGTNAQQWLIKDAGDGAYNIVSKLDHMYLDIANGTISNNNNVWIYHGNGTNAQKFNFTKVEIAQKIPNGLYTINSIFDENKVVSLNTEVSINSANVQLEANKNNNSQKWYTEYLGNGYYKIKSALAGNRYLDVTGGAITNGTNVQIYSGNTTNAQIWYIKDTGDGYFNIISKNNNLFLDLSGGYSNDGTNLQVYTGNDTNAQKFKFIETTYNEYVKTYDDGYYRIASSLNLNKNIDANNASKKNGTNIQIYENNGTTAQIWYLTYLNEDPGYYMITSSMNPNISLNTSSDGNVNIMKKNKNNDSQKWLVKDLGDGTISVMSKSNGLYLTVDGVDANSVNVRTSNYDRSSKQVFKLNPDKTKKVYNGIDVSHHQKTISWDKVESAGVGFAILRVGYGDDALSQDDRSFNEYVKGCEANNIPYGVYLYSYAKDVGGTNDSATSEANHVLRQLRTINKEGNDHDLGTKVFIDMEDASVISSGRDKLTEVVKTFCSIIESNGYTCGVYANHTWLTKYLNGVELASKMPIWYSWYPNIKSPSHNWAKANLPTNNPVEYKYWQFASDGIINGINGYVDMDLGFDIFD